MTNNGFQEVVLEKLSAIEQRMAGIERQMTMLVNSYRIHGERIAELESTCLLNHAASPAPKEEP